jgi:hypothetical protein
MDSPNIILAKLEEIIEKLEQFPIRLGRILQPGNSFDTPAQ